MDLQMVSTQAERLGITEPEETLGKGLLQPFNASNSGGRKQMFNTENAQKVQLINCEVPYISTGYENKYGELASCFVRSEDDLKIVARIPKFTAHKDHIYYLVFYNNRTQKYDVFEVTPYQFKTEFYGYLKNNDALKNLKPGDTIQSGSVMSKSISYDECDNRMDGINLLTCYMMVDETKEDSVCISESAMKKLSFPMIKKIQIAINENDIPRNSYGDSNVYKFMPDLLEYTKSKLLCGIRRQKNEEAFYTQAEDRLSKNQFGDDNFIAEGQVIDIDIYCNNPERLGTTTYDDQLKYYYDDHIRLCNDIVSLVNALGGPERAEYNLQYMYRTALDCLNGKKYKRPTGSEFSNILMEVTVLNRALISPTDKIANRYGGKGVISVVQPDALMPHTMDGKAIDVIQTKNTVIRRENIGQLWEMHMNHISGSIINYIRSDLCTPEEGYELYRKFLRMVSDTFAEKTCQILDQYIATDEEIKMFVDSLIESDYIYISTKPITDNMTIDRLSALYKEFPMAKLEYMLMPIVSSTDEIEYVQSSRPMVFGPIYYYRLKQMGEEKMSATSLSSTNLKDLNTKSKNFKQNKSAVKGTPVNIGNQEYMDLDHMGPEVNITTTLLYANSPLARRCCIELLTGDPFNPNIQLIEEASNRAAEINNAYLKTKGIRLEIVALPKCKYDPFVQNPFVIKK